MHIARWRNLTTLSAEWAELVKAAQSEHPQPVSMAQALVHCAHSINCSLDGFPVMKSSLIRATVGPLVKNRFLRRGALRHSLTAPIAGVPFADSATTPEAALQQLKASIERFAKHQGPCAPHFVYGRVSHADYDALHALHLCDHLSQYRAG
jgi:Protein of unknown function (DUF1569)